MNINNLNDNEYIIFTFSNNRGLKYNLIKNIIKYGYYVCAPVFVNEWKTEYIISDNIDDFENCAERNITDTELSDYIYSKAKNIFKSEKQIVFLGNACYCRDFLSRNQNNELIITVENGCRGEFEQDYIGELNQGLNEKEKEQFCNSIRAIMNYEVVDDSCCSHEVVEGNQVYVQYVSRIAFADKCYQKCNQNTRCDIFLPEMQGNVVPYSREKVYCARTISKAGKQLFFKLVRDFDKFGILNEIKNPVYTSCHSQISKAIKSKGKNSSADHFDILLAAIWLKNYGSALTNFALYNVLEELGYSVLMLNTNSTVPKHILDIPEKSFAKFAWEHYRNSIEFINSKRDINTYFDTCIVGSEQIWNYDKILRTEQGIDCYFLGFTDDNKKRISYATSFGEKEELPKGDLLIKTKKLLKRFDAISVREKNGVEISDSLGCKAQKVMDAVFLLDKSEYYELSDSVPRLLNDKYLFCYILEPSEQKIKEIKSISSKYSLEPIIVLDSTTPKRDLFGDFMHVYDILKVEEWLSGIRYAEYIITDSYHATCFSLIFEKIFVTYWCRQTSRFETFLEIPEVNDRIVHEGDNIEIILEKNINYSFVNNWLKKEIDISKKWLIESLRG